MTHTLSEAAIVRVVAQKVARRITHRVIADLQQMAETLSGDDSELKTTWDEICAQVQDGESFHWSVYDDVVRSIVDGYVAGLAQHERDAIWFQTEAATDWDCENPEDRDANPVVDNDIVQYVTREYVFAEAGRWSNARIRAYIERSGMSD